MNYADALSEMTHNGLDSLWRAVKAMPEDKIEWKPTPETRSSRELLEELVMTTAYSAKLVRTQKEPSMEGEEKSANPKSMEELEKEHRAAVEDFLMAVKEFPEADLHQTVDLSWGKMNFLQVIAYPYWNLMYHFGQISYIQIMYGDKKTY